MATFTERDGVGILTAAVDIDLDPLNVIRINGDANLIDVDIPLSVGGAVRVQADGVVTFDDAGLVWPDPGQSLADSVIAQVSDGLNVVDVAVNILVHRP